MGLDDLVEFDRAAYAHRVSQMSIVELKGREIQKTRQYFSGYASGGLGLGSAPFTGGASLIFTALGARKAYVASKKNEIIKTELARRGVPLHDKLTTADIVVPATGGIVSMVAGGFADAAFDHSAAPTGTPEVQAATASVEQSVDITQLLAANAVGSMAAESARWAMVKFEGEGWRDAFRRSFGCCRLAGSGGELSPLYCDGCSKTLEMGMYARKWLSISCTIETKGLMIINRARLL
jgi:hypothetical protein